MKKDCWVGLSALTLNGLGAWWQENDQSANVADKFRGMARVLENENKEHGGRWKPMAGTPEGEKFLSEEFLRVSELYWETRRL